jgi:hypothetical protein
MRRILALLIVLFVILSQAAAFAEEPRREDMGDLIVLHLYGSYYEMGRQEAELLGPDLRNVYDYQLANYRRLVSEAGLRGPLLNNIVVPLFNTFGPITERSGFHDEIAGMASVMGVPSRNVMRALLSLSAGSTVFAAARSATADGQAVIGRNVDWNDAFGRRRPVVAYYHPDGDALDYIFVGWPLVGLPTVGLNEAGLAISFNFFISDPQVSLCFPQWPHRLALEKARTVEEAIQIITKPRRRGISAFLVLADATGDIAMVEFTPTRSAVFRPDGDWFGQANHARTPEMIPYDRYRHPDSFMRREGMENAVRPHLGSLTPALAVEILRDRGNSPYANASNVANLGVLNAAVVHPASRTLWHSTTMQPHAPFGEFVPFTFDEDAQQPAFPASGALVSPKFEREREEIQAVRHALELQRDGKSEQAQEAWDDLLASQLVRLDATRLALGSALTRDALKDNASAFAILEQSIGEGAPFEVRAIALVARGILADRLGDRPQAIRSYGEALTHLATHPEFTGLAYVQNIAERGVKRSQGKAKLPISWYDVAVPE